MSDIRVKICGVKELRHIDAAARAGATYLGFVFFEKSPRYVSLTAARDLAMATPAGVAKVALCVDADDAALDALTQAVPLDMFQLHGEETPERVAAIRARYGLPVMKAVGVRDARDLKDLEAYAQVSDQLLVDAKAPKGADLPGGNGLAFDWRLIAGRRWPVPWMLAGGLTVDTVGEAIRLTGATQVDVSSGVEAAPGVKDSALIEAFVTAAKA
ncbi:MAG: phosphoribosylanthranilate isomerase [Pseudomonadota bacterium]